MICVVVTSYKPGPVDISFGSNWALSFHVLQTSALTACLWNSSWRHGTRCSVVFCCMRPLKLCNLKRQHTLAAFFDVVKPELLKKDAIHFLARVRCLATFCRIKEPTEVSV